MAASYTAERKVGTVGNFTSFGITPASNCTTGSTLILLMSSGVNGSQVATLSDNKGNTWNIDKQVTGTLGIVTIASSYQVAGLTTGDTITVTVATGGIGYQYWLEEFAGNYSTVDVSSTASTSSSTTAATGTTAATTAADEMAICSVVSLTTSVTITKNASYTLFTTGQQTSAATTGSAWYRILTATGTQNGNGTLSSMANNAGLIATYKAGTVAAKSLVVPGNRTSRRGSLPQRILR